MLLIGIFEENFKKKSLPVVKPGSQSRKFTHVQDTVDTHLCMEKNQNAHYSISNNKSYSIIQLAKLLATK